MCCCFKQETEYEMGVRLVGSEMGMRDSARGGLDMANEQASFFAVIVTGQVEFADVRFMHPRAASNPTRAFPSRRAFAFVPIGKWTSPPLAKHHEHHYSDVYSDPTNRPTCSRSSPVHPTDSRLRQRVLQVRGGARRRLEETSMGEE